MPFKTKLTELCKIEHPIIQGGMHYVGCKPRLTQNPALPGSQSSITFDSSRGHTLRLVYCTLDRRLLARPPPHVRPPVSHLLCPCSPLPPLSPTSQLLYPRFPYIIIPLCVSRESCPWFLLIRILAPPYKRCRTGGRRLQRGWPRHYHSPDGRVAAQWPGAAPRGD